MHLGGHWVGDHRVRRDRARSDRYERADPQRRLVIAVAMRHPAAYHDPATRTLSHHLFAAAHQRNAPGAKTVTRTMPVATHSAAMTSTRHRYPRPSATVLVIPVTSHSVPSAAAQLARLEVTVVTATTPPTPTSTRMRRTSWPTRCPLHRPESRKRLMSRATCVPAPRLERPALRPVEPRVGFGGGTTLAKRHGALASPSCVVAARAKPACHAARPRRSATRVPRRRVARWGHSPRASVRVTVGDQSSWSLARCPEMRRLQAPKPLPASTGRRSRPVERGGLRGGARGPCSQRYHPGTPAPPVRQRHMARCRLCGRSGVARGPDTSECSGAKDQVHFRDPRCAW
jgi:hypothetical protein